MRCLTRLLCFMQIIGCFGCFGSVLEPARTYYILQLSAIPKIDMPHINGLLQVRDLDVDSVYDRTQIVMRHGPVEVAYKQRDIWAVKPSKMLSEIIARGISDQHIFSGVSHELTERRPDYVLTGELQAIDIYEDTTKELSQDAGSLFAHLAINLQISHLETDKIIWNFQYNQHQKLKNKNIGIAIQTFSNMTTDAITQAVSTMRNIKPMLVDDAY